MLIPLISSLKFLVEVKMFIIQDRHFDNEETSHYNAYRIKPYSLHLLKYIFIS
jgi:hypothetical protein